MHSRTKYPFHPKTAFQVVSPFPLIQCFLIFRFLDAADQIWIVRNPGQRTDPSGKQFRLIVSTFPQFTAMHRNRCDHIRPPVLLMLPNLLRHSFCKKIKMFSSIRCFQLVYKLPHPASIRKRCTPLIKDMLCTGTIHTVFLFHPRNRLPAFHAYGPPDPGQLFQAILMAAIHRGAKYPFTHRTARRI